MRDFSPKPDSLIANLDVNRRTFLGGTVALGLAAGFSGTLIAGKARAEEPKRGGHLKLGLKGAPPPICSTRPPIAAPSCSLSVIYGAIRWSSPILLPALHCLRLPNPGRPRPMRRSGHSSCAAA